NSKSLLQTSEEYGQLSEDAKFACSRVLDSIPHVPRRYHDYFRVDGCTEMIEGQNLKEGIDNSDFVASGCFTSAYSLNGRDHVFSTNFSEGRDIGGLLWAAVAKHQVFTTASKRNRFTVSIMLIANEDRPSKFD
ncbi:hypothetical protein PMAYCL1PPCAC_04636, partial [Pristionchus mayeri]